MFAGNEIFSEFLRNNSRPVDVLIYSEVYLIGHRFYSVKKVRLLNVLQFVLFFIGHRCFSVKQVRVFDKTAVCLFENSSPNVTSESEKMEAPFLNLVHRCLSKEGFLYSLSLG